MIIIILFQIPIAISGVLNWHLHHLSNVSQHEWLICWKWLAQITSKLMPNFGNKIVKTSNVQRLIFPYKSKMYICMIQILSSFLLLGCNFTSYKQASHEYRKISHNCFKCVLCLVIFKCYSCISVSLVYWQCTS